jgi:hypothetical protein
MAARTHGELLGNVRYALACRVIPNTSDRIVAQQSTFVFGITRQAKAYRTLLPDNKNAALTNKRGVFVPPVLISEAPLIRDHGDLIVDLLDSFGSSHHLLYITLNSFALHSAQQSDFSVYYRRCNSQA